MTANKKCKGENVMKETIKKVQDAMMCMTRQCWEQGILAQALLETGQQEMLERVIHDMIVRQSGDGRLCNVENTPAVTDSAFCIPAVLLTGRKMNNSAYIEAAKKNVRFLMEEAEHGKDGTLFHMIHTQEVWADSAAFLPYSLALAGHYREAFVQIEGICSRLYSEEKGLYLHMWDDKTQTYIRPLAWGVGNGWILSGLLRTLLVWDHAYEQEEKQMKDRFYQLLDGMLAVETNEHGFHDILDDPETFQESETAAMVAYVIYRAVREKLLSPAYVNRADAIRDALYKKIDEMGFVRDAAGSPSFDRPGTAVECQAHVLMMEQAYKQIR